MGGNLKFYKEHFMKDYLIAKSCSKSHRSTTNSSALGSPPREQRNHTTNYPALGCLPREQRNRSISDQDSDPEALRFSQKYQTHGTNGDVMEQSNTADLSFDHYSTIYQPEFLLNVAQRPHQNHVIGDILEEHVVLKKTKHLEERTIEGNLGKEVFEKKIKPVQLSERKSGERNKEKVDLKPVVALSSMVQRKRTKVIKDTANEKVTRPVQSLTNEEVHEYLRQENVAKTKAKVELVGAPAKERRRNFMQTYKKDKVQLVQTPKKITSVREWDKPDDGEDQEAWKMKTIVQLSNNLAKPFLKKQDSKDETLSGGDRDYLQNKLAENINNGVVRDIPVSMKKVSSKNTNKTISPKSNVKDCNVQISFDEKYETLEMKQQNTKSAEYDCQKLVDNKTLDRKYPVKNNSKIAQKIVKTTNIFDDKTKEEKNVSSKNYLGSLSLKISLDENKSTAQDHNTDWFSPITTRDTNDLLYPESPTAETSFYKTPCSTRHNSVASLEDSDEDNVGDFEEVINPKVSYDRHILVVEFSEF